MRAQTTLDFAIGITIFLAVVMFVFGFVPGILEPFDATGQETPTHSDRIADSLSQGTLGSPDEPYVLDRYCTTEFFNVSFDAPTECNYTGSTLAERLNLSDSMHVNVSIRGNLTGGTDSKVLCWSDTSAAHSEPGLDEIEDCDSDDQVFRTGEEIPGPGRSTITSRRVVSLAQEPVTIEVVVW